MNILTPKLSTEDVAAATERKFTSAPVEAGIYQMQINPKSSPLVITSKNGNPYLQLMLVHTGDMASKGTAVYPNFNLNDVGNAQFAQMMLALGFSAQEVANAGWGTTSEEKDAKGRKQGVVAVNGDPIELAGRTLSVYLKKTESDYDGRTTIRNEVARFVIG